MFLEPDEATSTINLINKLCENSLLINKTYIDVQSKNSIFLTFLSTQFIYFYMCD